MKISPEEFRRAVLEVVQPLARGRFILKAAKFSRLDDIPQFEDDWDQFLDATPFGLAVNPSDKVLAYYLNLGGSGLAPIIIGHQDLRRPLPAKGGSILYSTDAAGDTLQALVFVKPDGTVDLESIIGGLKIVVAPDGTIRLGSAGSSEPLVLGTAFTTLFNAHNHIGNLGIPTGIPLTPMGAAHISAKSFTEI